MAGVLSYALSLKTNKFTGPLSNASSGIASFTGKAAATVGVLGTMAVGLGAITAAAGVTAVAFKSLKAAAEFEQTSVSFRVLIGNAKEAIATLNRLRQFANTTPFEFKEVATAGKKLLAMGSSTGQLTAELRALGDVAAGMGVPLGDMADLYGKIRLKGKIMGEELIQLSERGIPLVDMLAKKYGKTKEAIVKMGSDGKIGVGELQQALIDLTSKGGKFHGMMQEQSGTTLGLWSTLKSAVDELYITLGTPINDAIKPVLAGAIAQVQDLGARTGAFFALLAEASSKGGFADVLGAGLVLAASKFINVMAGGIRGSVAFLGAALPTIIAAAKDSLFSKNNMEIISWTFASAAEALKGGILEGVAALSKALHLPDSMVEDLKTAASIARSESSMLMSGARGEMADFGGPKAFDAADALSGMIQGSIDAAKAGSEAFKNASGKQLIDTTPLKADFADKSKGLNKENLNTVLYGAKSKNVKQESLKVEKSPTKGKQTPKSKTSPLAPALGPLASVKAKPKMLQPLTLAQRSRKARKDRRSAADGGIGAFKIHNFARQNKISFKEAKEKLTAGSRAASPRQARRNASEKAARDAASKAATEGTLLKIAANMENFAVA